MTPIDAPSPNFDARTAPPTMIVLHYTGMKSGQAALDRLRDPEAKVSSHYLVEEDGRVFRLVAEERRAWHAGVSFWRGRRNVNGDSIGIEIVNPGHEFGYRPFPEAQIDSVIALVTDIRTRWDIEDRDIVGHSDVAPARKDDPGELFPWKRLSEAGHGLWAEWPAPRPARRSARARRGRRCSPCRRASPAWATTCRRPAASTPTPPPWSRAFQRHWRPERVDGVADGETRARLIALLRVSSLP